MLVGQRLRHFDVAFYMRRGSPYKAPIDRVVLALRESGLSGHILREGLKEKRDPRKVSEGEKEWVKLGLSAMQSSFVLLATGLLVCSTVVLAMEVFMSKLISSLTLNNLEEIELRVAWKDYGLDFVSQDGDLSPI